MDTNVLVRYVTQDDLVQSPKATAWIERRLTPDNPGFISIGAIAETAWVLERTYGLSDQAIAGVIERLLQADVLVVEDEQQVFTAMITLRESLGSFADALIAALGAKAGCSNTLTFDQKALRLPGFTPA
ncbi:MAG TPA: type II toxin-antitoxin system VapC family toxin [Xanthobacteraceae bacterium]|nr:type II toxin-antitoxin system VapC family toxin [Xanthobacteraceae bacterium]